MNPASLGRTTRSHAWMRLLVTLLGCVVAPPAGAVDSMTNAVEGIETISNGELLLVHLATDIFASRGDADPLRNVGACAQGPSVPVETKAVVIRLQATTPVESLELDLMLKILETSQIGPIRIVFEIWQGECVDIFEFPTPVPVATRVAVVQCKVGQNCVPW